MKEIKESKVRVKKNRKKEFDTLSITRELEKSINIDDELKREADKKKNENRKKIKKKLIIAVAVILLLGIGSYIAWITKPYPTIGDYNSYLGAGGFVRTEKEDNGDYVFTPVKNEKSVGVIIYPSEKIQPTAYANMARKIAENGYEVVVANLKFTDHIFGTKLTAGIMDQHKNITKWILVAHSSSGNQVLKEGAGQKNIVGVVFLGTYPIGDDLKLINKPVLSIWGTKDGIVDFTRFNDFKSNMPQEAVYFEIVGGNNTNFADINLLPNDNKAIISPDKQKEIAVKKIVDFIKVISKQDSINGMNNNANSEMNSESDVNANGVTNSDNQSTNR